MPLKQSKKQPIKKRVEDYSSFLFNSVTEKDVLLLQRGRLYHNGRVLDQQEVADLVVLAKELRKNPLFLILANEMRHLGNKKIYFDATTTDDILVGKAVLLAWDVLCRKVDNLAALK